MQVQPQQQSLQVLKPLQQHNLHPSQEHRQPQTAQRTPSSTPTESATSSGSGAKVPIIVSVSSIFGSIAFLLAFGLLCLRRRRRKKDLRRDLVKSADLLERKQRPEIQSSIPSPGEPSEIDGEEKLRKGPEGDTGERCELPA